MLNVKYSQVFLDGESVIDTSVWSHKKNNVSPCKKVQILLKHDVRGAADATDFALVI